MQQNGQSTAQELRIERRPFANGALALIYIYFTE